jgi:hypothetical protein
VKDELSWAFDAQEKADTLENYGRKISMEEAA